MVDYVGIASALKQAMNDYTGRDKANYGDTDVAKAAHPKFLEKLSICRDLFHGFDYSGFTTGTDLERARCISGAVNFVTAQDSCDMRDRLLRYFATCGQEKPLSGNLKRGEKTPENG